MVQSIEDSSLWNISNQINLRRSQISWLFPLESNIWKCLYRSPYNYREPLELFLWRKSSLIFWTDGQCHICTIYTYIQKISNLQVFLGKDHLSFSVQKKVSHFREKIPYFQIIQGGSYSRAIFWKDRLFRTFEKNIMFPCIFLRKIIFHFPSKK